MAASNDLNQIKKTYGNIICLLVNMQSKPEQCFFVHNKKNSNGHTHFSVPDSEQLTLKMMLTILCSNAEARFMAQ